MAAICSQSSENFTLSRTYKAPKPKIDVRPVSANLCSGPVLIDPVDERSSLEKRLLIDLISL